MKLQLLKFLILISSLITYSQATDRISEIYCECDPRLTISYTSSSHIKVEGATLEEYIHIQSSRKEEQLILRIMISEKELLGAKDMIKPTLSVREFLRDFERKKRSTPSLHEDLEETSEKIVSSSNYIGIPPDYKNVIITVSDLSHYSRISFSKCLLRLNWSGRLDIACNEQTYNDAILVLSNDYHCTLIPDLKRIDVRSKETLKSSEATQEKNVEEILDNYTQYPISEIKISSAERVFIRGKINFRDFDMNFWIQGGSLTFESESYNFKSSKYHPD